MLADSYFNEFRFTVYFCEERLNQAFFYHCADRSTRQPRKCIMCQDVERQQTSQDIPVPIPFETKSKCKVDL